MSHKYRIGQRVRRTGGGATAPVDARTGLGEVCEIVRLMPADVTGHVSYRVRAGFAERAVREDEIAALP